MPEPILDYQEKAFYLSPASRPDGTTFAGIINPDVGDGSPLGVAIRYNLDQLPKLTEWKMPRQGHYVLGIEPGTVLPRGRADVRARNELPTIDGQAEYDIDIEIQVLDSAEELSRLQEEAREILDENGRSQ